ncbi:very-long-chain aldehyde decarbonylase GL1-11-like [Panicum virgatum]|uniref:very-long-chain aldehyde decarbonylase GL1-11-like n=1 Tax=Panicum virgatum TaxID=38727 RepID=UPI0019D60C67|nr:very-long-chain aldehyde decarbonylase GL1-11-like [Panicum virgatum]
MYNKKSNNSAYQNRCVLRLKDFIFYWGHRALHTKWVYKHVHGVHHEYATPFGLTSEYAHPAEILFLGFATVVSPALTGSQWLPVWELFEKHRLQTSWPTRSPSKCSSTRSGLN